MLIRQLTDFSFSNTFLFLEWFFTLPIECDGYMVDCIIDNRLQQRYKTLEKIMKKKGLETLSGILHDTNDRILLLLENKKLNIWYKLVRLC